MYEYEALAIDGASLAMCWWGLGLQARDRYSPVVSCRVVQRQWGKSQLMMYLSPSSVVRGPAETGRNPRGRVSRDD
ncbi:hypothetical protein HBI56_095300 [Parastagonospora nodorum]|nr:hypothetical protein HBH56_090590 [Parastagonospora nodorum]KAH3936142.1 hypothetical protein HBH54_025230 [Parastagonospora nodorum]KAH3945527.1 hypothetical protein HBH53_142330 [Parastagonospora nodorum]KAH3966639.1 hypothetical protein HBH51_143030 [Parastagonospora nodorum]KAH3998227.1 hypothetical protein HBI10_130920 [Parastagonospora nodorum]